MYDSYLQLRRMYDINYDSHISISDGVIITLLLSLIVFLISLFLCLGNVKN